MGKADIETLYVEHQKTLYEAFRPIQANRDGGNTRNSYSDRRRIQRVNSLERYIGRKASAIQQKFHAEEKFSCEMNVNVFLHSVRRRYMTAIIGQNIPRNQHFYLPVLFLKGPAE